MGAKKMEFFGLRLKPATPTLSHHHPIGIFLDKVKKVSKLHPCFSAFSPSSSLTIYLDLRQNHILKSKDFEMCCKKLV